MCLPPPSPSRRLSPPGVGLCASGAAGFNPEAVLLSVLVRLSEIEDSQAEIRRELTALVSYQVQGW